VVSKFLGLQHHKEDIFCSTEWRSHSNFTKRFDDMRKMLFLMTNSKIY